MALPGDHPASDGDIGDFGAGERRPSRRAGSSEAQRRYAAVVLDRECRQLAAMPPDSGRNQHLNTAAFRLGLMVHAGAIEEHHVVAELTAAALRSGLGQVETQRTIASGLAGAARKAPASLVQRAPGSANSVS